MATTYKDEGEFLKELNNPRDGSGQYREYQEQENLNLDNYPKTSWTNGNYSINWLYDEVIIMDIKGNRYSRMQGGDFECILQGLLSVNPTKKEDLY